MIFGKKPWLPMILSSILLNKSSKFGNTDHWNKDQKNISSTELAIGGIKTVIMDFLIWQSVLHGISLELLSIPSVVTSLSGLPLPHTKWAWLQLGAKLTTTRWTENCSLHPIGYWQWLSSHVRTNRWRQQLLARSLLHKEPIWRMLKA